MKLKNQVVVITGASHGLGKAIALKAAEEGATIGLVARDEELLKQTQIAIRKHGGRSEYFVCDIRSLDNVQMAVKEIYEKFKNVDILVNNAGVWTDNDLEKDKPEGMKNALETNALGNIYFTKEMLPKLEKKNQGYIFNVISTSGVPDIDAGDNTNWQVYGASKWALAGYTKALKESLRKTKIKVTAFFPGGFESDLYETAGRPNPHHQFWMMKTEDIADVVIFALTRPDDVLIEKLVVTKHGIHG